MNGPLSGLRVLDIATVFAGEATDEMRSASILARLVRVAEHPAPRWCAARHKTGRAG